MAAKAQITVPLSPAWSAKLEAALVQSGTNRSELTNALAKVPEAQWTGLVFLLVNMPERDLTTLTSDYLLENLHLAYEARAKVPWGASLPDELFFNDVLPYASVNETRDRWRAVLYQKCLPLIEGCQTPAQAGQRLNEKIFGLLKVKYSTGRRRADQSPLESIESGLASCTGLSILLVDACRAVGVPARVVGTPNWFNKRGNHTWVEIWDQRWHFAGAAEPDGKGLNHGWFAGDAARATKESPEHAIYASSFARTDIPFPLVWARRVDYVSAVNVTDHYTSGKAVADDPTRVAVRIRVYASNTQHRVAALVRATRLSDTNSIRTGTSKGDSADLNDLLSLSLRRNETYLIEATHEGRAAQAHFRSGEKKDELLELRLGMSTPRAAVATVCAVPQSIVMLPADDEAALLAAAHEFFTADAEKQEAWKFSERHEELLRDFEPACRALLWRAYRAAPIHEAMQESYASNQVRHGKYISPYVSKTVGTKPSGGWPLFIAMHGGGGAPKRVNDSQWKVMQNYYRDQTNLPGYVYLALRAPNDSWNGFYDTYVYPLIDTLTRQQFLFGDVDPNKVFIMGYSHGGYGSFAIGPKIPDHFAAIHSSAAAPTDGETTPKTLRHTPFTFMIGEKDHAYGRLARCTNFNNEIVKLRGERTDIYPVTMEYRENFGHGGLPDRNKISDLYPAVRNPVPRDLSWEMTDKVVTNFFWLRTSSPAKKRFIEADCLDNRLTLKTSTNLAQATVFLDTRLVDFQRPVVFEINGRATTNQLRPSLKTFCQTLLERGDPDLAFSVRKDFDLQQSTD